MFDIILPNDNPGFGILSPLIVMGRGDDGYTDGSSSSNTNSGNTSAGGTDASDHGGDDNDDHDDPDPGWRDSDGDGIADNMDKYPNDPNRSGYGEDSYGQNDDPTDYTGDDSVTHTDPAQQRAANAHHTRESISSQIPDEAVRRRLQEDPTFFNRVLGFLEKTASAATLGLSDLANWNRAQMAVARRAMVDEQLEELGFTREEINASYNQNPETGEYSYAQATGEGGEGGDSDGDGAMPTSGSNSDGTGSAGGGNDGEGAMGYEESLADAAQRSQDIADESWEIYRDTFLPYEEATAQYNQQIQELGLEYYQSVMPERTAYDTAYLQDQTAMLEMSADARHENLMTGLEVQNQYLHGAMEGVDPEQWAREGAADMISRYDAAENETMSALAGMGGSRSSAIDAIAKMNMAQAKDVGAAMTSGRRSAETENWNRLSGAASQVTGLPSANPVTPSPTTSSNGTSTTASTTSGAMGNAVSGYSNLYSGQNNGSGNNSMSIGDWTLAGAMAGSNNGAAGMAGGALLGWGIGQAERIFG
jgi:Holliday junction resolvasome RuvABC DNA-binding subunit